MLFRIKSIWWLLCICIVVGVAIFFSTRPVSVKGFQNKMGTLSKTEGIRYAKSVVKKHPRSQAALYATLVYLQVEDEHGNFLDNASQAAKLKHILKYHPKSVETLSRLAEFAWATSREEAIAYLKKVIALEPFHIDSHILLGTIYQELGDYKPALVYLKKAKKLHDAKVEASHTHDEHHPQLSVGYIYEVDGEKRVLSADQITELNLLRDIAAIESGTPIVGPGINEHADDFGLFIMELKKIEDATSSSALENLFMREMALHLQGKQAAFEPERIIRAYETIEQHGETEGIKHLRKTDPDLASAVSKDIQHRKNQ